MTFSLSIPSESHYSIPDKCNKNIAVDIGANAGKVSIHLSKLFYKVYSYEPIKFLYEMILDYKIENITCFNEAVLDKTGKTEIICHFNKDSGSSTTKACYDSVIEKKHWTGGQINEVEVVDLETVLNRCGGHIDYLKMDCENGEFLILNEKDLKNIDFIGIEIHNQMGRDNFYKLKSWVDRTHSGFPEWTDDNQEVLLINKNLK